MPMGGVYGARTLLCVNLDHVAELREARPSDGFDPAAYAAICDRAGCAGVSAHLRRDRRYVRDSDVSAIRESISGRFNLEIGLSDEMVDLAGRMKPDLVTIVPEAAGEIAGEGGLDVKACLPGIRDVVRSLHDNGIQVSFFIEPDIEMVAYSKECAADRVEICTAGYCNAREGAGIDREIRRICEATENAAKSRLYVTAGQGLGYMNIELLLNAAGLVEVHIGRSIISRSVETGLRQALDEMLEILE